MQARSIPIRGRRLGISFPAPARSARDPEISAIRCRCVREASVEKQRYPSGSFRRARAIHRADRNRACDAPESDAHGGFSLRDQLDSSRRRVERFSFQGCIRRIDRAARAARSRASVRRTALPGRLSNGIAACGSPRARRIDRGSIERYAVDDRARRTSEARCARALWIQERQASRSHRVARRRSRLPPAPAKLHGSPPCTRCARRARSVPARLATALSLSTVDPTDYSQARVDTIRWSESPSSKNWGLSKADRIRDHLDRLSNPCALKTK